MPNSKKRFDGNPRKRFNNFDHQFGARIPDQSADMLEAKRVRFKDPNAVINQPRRGEFGACSARSEAREDPVMPVADSGGPKTSEFAYFKRLKKGPGHTSRINSVNRESSQMKNFGPAKNGRELGDLKFSKDVKAPMFSEKSSTLDIGSFLCRQDGVEHSSGIHKKLDADTERLESPSVIRTPTTIDLDAILSTSATASMNPGVQSKGDIFSSKRLKLQQLISKTLFPETDELPKECDVVSLLMSRLLPESSSKIPSESRNHTEPELKDNCEEHVPDSSIEFDEGRDGTQNLIKTNVDNFLCGGISASYRETHRSRQIIEDVNTFASTCDDSMLLEFKEGDNKGSSFNVIDSELRSGMFDGRNLLTWNNDHCDYSPQYKTSSSIFKNEVQDEFCNDFDSDQSLKFRGHTHSYEFPAICYDRFDDNHSRRNCLEYKYERPGYKFERFGSSSLNNLRDSPDLGEFVESCHRRCLDYNDERPDCKFESFESSSLGYLKDSADLDEFAEHHCRSCLEFKDDRFDCKLDSRAPDNWHSGSTFGNFRDLSELHEIKIRREHDPLLLPWVTDDTNMNASTHLTDINHDDTSLGVYPSTLQDHCIEHHWQHKKDGVTSSSCGPLTLLSGPNQLSVDDIGLFRDGFRGSSIYVISEDHNHFMGNTLGETVAPMLISQGFDSHLALQSESLSDCIEQQYDISTHNVSQLVRHEKCLEMPQSEELSFMNVDIIAEQREVSFPVQLHRIRWLDTAVETNYDNLQIATLDNFL